MNDNADDNKCYDVPVGTEVIITKDCRAVKWGGNKTLHAGLLTGYEGSMPIISIGRLLKIRGFQCWWVPATEIPTVDLSSHSHMICEERGVDLPGACFDCGKRIVYRTSHVLTYVPNSNKALFNSTIRYSGLFSRNFTRRELFNMTCEKCAKNRSFTRMLLGFTRERMTCWACESPLRSGYQANALRSKFLHDHFYLLCPDCTRDVEAGSLKLA